MKSWTLYGDIISGNTLEEAMVAGGYSALEQPDFDLIGSLFDEIAYKPPIPEGTLLILSIDPKGICSGWMLPTQEAFNGIRHFVGWTYFFVMQDDAECCAAMLSSDTLEQLAQRKAEIEEDPADPDSHGLESRGAGKLPPDKDFDELADEA